MADRCPLKGTPPSQRPELIRNRGVEGTGGSEGSVRHGGEGRKGGEEDVKAEERRRGKEQGISCQKLDPCLPSS